MARGPRYTIKRTGWMSKIGLQPRKRGPRAPKPAFANLRGLGRTSLLAASALGTVLIVSPVAVQKAHAIDINGVNNPPTSYDFPFDQTLGSGQTVNVNNGVDCNVTNDTCIDIRVYDDGPNDFAVLFDGGEHDLEVYDYGDAIVIESWDDGINITVTNTNTASEIKVETGAGIVVYADNQDQLGNVNITWLGDIATGDDGVVVANENWGNVGGDVNITVGEVDSGNTGIFVDNIVGDVTIDAGDIDSGSSGNVDVGDNISVTDVRGDVTVTAGMLTGGGANNDGVFIDPIFGDVTITIDGANKDGDDSDGVDVVGVFESSPGDGGNVNVTVNGNLDTSGDFANGVDISDADGTVVVDVKGYINTGDGGDVNDFADGVLIDNIGGSVSVEANAITTNGFGSDGIEVQDVVDNVTVDVNDTIDVTGDFAGGISVYAVGGDVDITAEDINVDGDGFLFGPYRTGGVVVGNVGGDVTVGTGNIDAVGNFADGVNILDTDGDVKVNVVGNIDTDGLGADGIDILNVGIPFIPFSGNVEIDVSGTIKTIGLRADGIEVGNVAGNANIDVADIVAEGPNSSGVFVYNVFGDVDIDTDNVSTDGDYSEGIYVEYVGGDVDINVTGNITTDGSSGLNDSEGVYVNEVGGNVDITVSGTIRTLDGDSDGIDVEDVQGALKIVAADIYTSGEGNADGVEVDRVYGNVTVTAGNIGTAGDNADGVDIEAVDGFVVVTTKEINTLGDDAAGISIGNVHNGDVTVTVNGDITTDGDGADGVSIVDVYQGGATGKVFGNITTSGTNSDGVFVDPINGDFIWTVYGDLNQSGDGSDGLELYDVFAFGGEAGNVIFTVTGDVNTNGDNADGIDIFNIDGSAIITIGGDIDTSALPGANDNANGILIGNVRGGVVVETGNITTSGEGSDGVEIFDVAENVVVDVLDVKTGTDSDPNDNSNGVVVSNIGGSITVMTGNIETNGDSSDGIEVYDAFNDDATIDLTAYGNITIHGDSHGVFVHDVDVDEINVAVNGITTEEDGSHGVNIAGNITGDATVEVYGDISVTGEGAYGVNIGNPGSEIEGDANVTVKAGASIIAGDISNPSHIGNGIDDNNNDAINIYAYGDIDVNIDGFVSASDDNLDLAAYGEDHDVRVNIGNTGTLSGRFEIYTEYDFGEAYGGSAFIYNDGNVELMGESTIYVDEMVEFNNNATVSVRSYDGQYASIRVYSQQEDQMTFNNNGTITLADANGDATDILALGDYEDTMYSSTEYYRMDFHGGPNSRLVVDTYLSDYDNSESDQLYIFGDVTGTTQLYVIDNDPSSPGAYNPEGVRVAWVYGDTNVGDFELAGGPIDKGLFVYDLYLKDGSIDPTGRDWVLASIPGQAAREAPELVTALEELGHQAMAAGTDRLNTLGDCAASYRPGVNPTSDVPGCDEAGATFWMTVLGRGMNVDRDTSAGLYGQSTDFDISYDQVMWGVIGGADGGKIWTNENGTLNSLYGGILGGYLNTSVDFDSGSNADYSGGMGGIYGGFESGAWFVNGVLSAMYGTLSFDNDVLDIWGGTEDSNVWQVGGVVDTGYRFGAERGMAGVYFEPGVTLSILSTSIDDAEWAGNEVAFDDNTSIRGRIGGKVGYVTDGGFESYVEASLWSEFGDDPSIVIDSLGPDADVSADGLGTWGDIGVGFNYTMDNWAIGAKADVEANQDFIGYGGSLKVQFSW